MREIVFATHNEHKAREVREILGESWKVLTLSDIGCHDDIPETADTLEGNALIKARWVRDRYCKDCFADDTGLMVDALGGAPGVMRASAPAPSLLQPWGRAVSATTRCLFPWKAESRLPR